MELIQKEKEWSRIRKEMEKLNEMKKKLDEQITKERKENYLLLQKENIEKYDMKEIPMTLKQFKEYMEINRFEKLDTLHHLIELSKGSFEIFKGKGMIGQYNDFFHHEWVISHGNINKLYLVKLKDGYTLIPYIDSKWNDHHRLSFEYANIVDARVSDMLFEIRKELKHEKEVLLNVSNKKVNTMNDEGELNRTLDNHSINTLKEGFFSKICTQGYRNISSNICYLFTVNNVLKIITEENMVRSATCYVRDVNDEDLIKIEYYKKLLDRKIAILEKVLEPWRLTLLFD
jgi:hypothetical protein